MYPGTERRRIQWDRNALTWWLLGIATAGVVLYLMDLLGLAKID